MCKKLFFSLFLASVVVLSGCAKDAVNNNNETENVGNTDSVTNDGESEETVTSSADMPMTSKEEIQAVRDLLWEEYIAELKADETRQNEVKTREMAYGEVTMKYGMQIKGDPDENGYPLYIALHGGGGSDTPTVNDQQWSHMSIYPACFWPHHKR